MQLADVCPWKIRTGILSCLLYSNNLGACLCFVLALSKAYRTCSFLSDAIYLLFLHVPEGNILKCKYLWMEKKTGKVKNTIVYILVVENGI